MLPVDGQQWRSPQSETGTPLAWSWASTSHLLVSHLSTLIFLTWITATWGLLTWGEYLPPEYCAPGYLVPCYLVKPGAGLHLSQNTRHWENGGWNPPPHLWLILHFPCLVKIFKLLSVNRLFQIVRPRVEQVGAVLGSIWPDHNITREKTELLAACEAEALKEERKRRG